MKKALFTAFATAMQVSCAMAGVPLRFDADARSTSTFQASAYRGETLDIEARLLWRGAPLEVAPGAGAALYWQTNGMGSAWWTAPASVTTSGVVSAVWSPTNDVGAAAYRLFLGVADGGANYRANMLLRMIDAPGAEPNALAPPLRTIDFSTVEVLNAPWIGEETDPIWEAEKGGYARADDLGSAAFVDTPRKYALDATNIVSITIQPLTTSDWEANYIGGFAISHPDYGSVSLSFPDDFTETESGWFGSVEMTKTAPRQFPRYLGSVLITNLVFGAELSTMTSSAVECSMDCVADWQGDSDNIHFVFYARSNWHDEWMSVGEAADLSASRAAVAATNYTDAAVAAAAMAATNYTDEAVAAIDIPDPDLSFTNGYARLADLGSAAYADADDYATPSDVATEVAAASNALGRAWSADAALLSMLLQGSNVVAEVTNYNSQVRSPSLRLLQLNASNEYDVVWSELTNLSKVAQDASDHADAVAVAALNTSTNYAAPRAWSGTTSGLGAEAPAGWTWISTPNLAIGGGLEFEKHATSGGAVWVLRNNGMVAQMNALTNNTAYLEISSLDGESVFRIEKTDAQTLGVNTARVSVDGSTLICGVDVVSASPPLVRLKTSLSQGEWVREEDGIPPSLADVQWEGESGAWVCRITNNSGGHSLFATMAVIQEGGTKIVPAAPMDAGAGILCTDGHTRIRPVNNNGAITWEIIQ